MKSLNRTAGIQITFARRRGVSVVELTVSVAVLMAAMSIATTLFFQVKKVWQDSRHQRIACQELNNQLDHLTRLEPLELKKQLARLEPSKLCAESLREPKLFGEISKDSLGIRISMSIDWKRRYGSKPLRLSAWLNQGSANLEEDRR
ncbi:MAG: hypothetical protein AAGA30_00110 [Planctomycetota bacterium]